MLIDLDFPQNPSSFSLYQSQQAFRTCRSMKKKMEVSERSHIGRQDIPLVESSFLQMCDHMNTSSLTSFP